MKIEVRVIVTRDDGAHVGDYSLSGPTPASNLEELLMISEIASEVAGGLDYLITHECDKPRAQRDGMVGLYDHRN